MKFTATVKDAMKLLRHNSGPFIYYLSHSTVIATHISDWTGYALHFRDLILEDDRTILSYRIPAGEKLELKPAQRDRFVNFEENSQVLRKLSRFAQLSKEDAGAVFLTIESPAHGLVKTFKFDLMATVQQSM